jgi:hypothetical protein
MSSPDSNVVARAWWNLLDIPAGTRYQCAALPPDRTWDNGWEEGTVITYQLERSVSALVNSPPGE